MGAQHNKSFIETSESPSEQSVDLFRAASDSHEQRNTVDEKVSLDTKAGVHVRAHSLQSKSLNGKIGVVLEASAGRLRIDFGKDIGPKRLKVDNLELHLDLEAGSDDAVASARGPTTVSSNQMSTTSTSSCPSGPSASSCHMSINNHKTYDN